MRKAKQHITFFFLTLFILIKTVGLHAFVHSEEEKDESCNVCEYAFTLNKIPPINDEQIAIKPTIRHNYNKQLFYEYSYFFTKNYTGNTLFCRPPPEI